MRPMPAWSSALSGKPVVIRTLDLGAEKFPQSMQQVIEATPNPTLGLRSLRLTLQNLPLFKTQLRAILRAAALGDVRVMFPLVSTLLELRQAKMDSGRCESKICRKKGSRTIRECRSE